MHSLVALQITVVYPWEAVTVFEIQPIKVTQSCMTAYCLYHKTYDPGISPDYANQCIMHICRHIYIFA